MERVADDTHPLANSPAPASISTNVATPSSSLQSQGHSQRSYRTPSASLIQSAVRSVLDDITPTSTIVSDDQSEASFIFPSDSPSLRFGKNKQAPPTLESLQMEKIPPIPDAQDRKRFIVSVTIGTPSRKLNLSLSPSIPYGIFCVLRRGV